MQYLKWVPSYEMNRDKPIGERIVMDLCPLTYGEISSANSRVVKTKAQDSEEFVDNRNEILLETIKKHVGKIENLKDIFDTPVSTGEQLADIRGDWGLILEAEAALINMSKLKAGLEKNLLPPSDGSQPSKKTAGTVNPVKKTD